MIDTQAVISNLLPDLHADTRAHLVYWAEADLIQFIDESVKRLARKAMMFVERDLSLTTGIGTATYALPARHLATLHASYGTAPLRPASQIELEAGNPLYVTVAGTPAYWYEDKIGSATVGLSPVPTAAAALPLIVSVVPVDIDVGKVVTTLEAPQAVAAYLAFSVLAQAYGRESESEMPDVAQHCAARVAFYEEIFTRYYGPGM